MARYAKHSLVPENPPLSANPDDSTFLKLSLSQAGLVIDKPSHLPLHKSQRAEPMHDARSKGLSGCLSLGEHAKRDEAQKESQLLEPVHGPPHDADSRGSGHSATIVSAMD